MSDSAPDRRSALEQAFHDAMLGIYDEASRLPDPYRPTRFRQMVLERGGRAAAEALLATPTPSEGFAELWLRDRRLDLTVEHLVLRSPWRDLFTADQLAVARARLTAADFSLPSDDLDVPSAPAAMSDATLTGAPPRQRLTSPPPPPPPAPSPRGDSAPVVAPTAGRARLTCVDATRGLAVLGLMAAHIVVFSHPMPLVPDPTILEPVGANAVFGWLINVLVLGKFMFLFALLFGASVIFFDAKSAGGPLSAGSRLWYRRMGWLAAIGLLHGLFLFFGDILLLYAICGMGALWWMRRLKPWILIAVGAGAYLVMALFLIAAMAAVGFMMGLEPSGGAEIEADAATVSADFGDMALFGSILSPEGQTDLNLGSYFDSMKVRLALWANATINIPFFTFWLGSAIMLLGMGLARIGVLTGERSTRFYVAMLAAGLAIGLPASALGFGWVMGDPEFRGLIWMGMFQLLGVPLSFAYLAAVVLLGRMSIGRPIETALAAVGRMALSNYVLHSILGAAIFHGWGLGWFGSMEFPELAWIVLVVWAINISFSLLWLRAFRFGPLEWLWRSLTYGRRQPMRRSAGA